MQDVQQQRFLDFTSGIGVTNTGHSHPKASKGSSFACPCFLALNFTQLGSWMSLRTDRGGRPGAGEPSRACAGERRLPQTDAGAGGGAPESSPWWSAECVVSPCLVLLLRSSSGTSVFRHGCTRAQNEMLRETLTLSRCCLFPRCSSGGGWESAEQFHLRELRCRGRGERSEARTACDRSTECDRDARWLPWSEHRCDVSHNQPCSLPSWLWPGDARCLRRAFPLLQADSWLAAQTS